MKIGIYGGRFDPVHTGHIQLAEAALKTQRLDRVIFVPSGKLPHKNTESLITDERRVALLQAAIQDSKYADCFELSEIELRKEEFSYTIDTLKVFKAQYPKAKLYLILGSDAYEGVYRWVGAEELTGFCKLLVSKRAGGDKSIRAEESFAYEKAHKKDIRFFNSKPNNTSSAVIRRKIANQEDISAYLPATEYREMLKNDDYGALKSAILQDIGKNLDNERYLHSVSVAETAKTLALRHFPDLAVEAYIAGLLHDNAKFLDKQPDKLVKYAQMAINRYPKLLNEESTGLKYKTVLHAFAGCMRALELFPGVFTERVLDAVCFHTTGRPEMSDLEKIIYVADFIEPRRPLFDDIQTPRRLAETNIQAAAKNILDQVVPYIQERGYNIHYLTLQARDYYEENKS